MRVRVIIQSAGLLGLLGCGGLDPSAGSGGNRVSSVSQAETTFTPVFEIMSRKHGKDSMGCGGCHVNGPLPFGLDEVTTEDQMLTQLCTERRDLMEQMIGGLPIIRFKLTSVDDGGDGSMPRGGMRWGPDELTLLDTWLAAPGYDCP